MPIGLLLTGLSAPLAAMATAFERWSAVLRLEAVVIDRARGAFLVEWFGARLPRIGTRLRVVIENIQALGERYREARSRSMGGQTGPNLLEPVAGLAGMAAGMFISPSGALMYLYSCLRESAGIIVSSLLTILYSPVFLTEITGLGTALAMVAFPLVLIGGFVVAIIAAAGGANSSMVLAFELLGDATRAIQALTRFINLLMGPREAIRNPLLKSILGLVDRIAALFAQLVGAAAWLVTRFGRMLLSTAMQFRALIDFAKGIWDVVDRIGRGTVTALQGADPEASPLAILMRLIDHVMAVARRLIEIAGAMLAEMVVSLKYGFGSIADRTRAEIETTVSMARSLIEDLPMIKMFRATARMVTVVRSIFASSGIGKSKPPAATPPPSSGGLGGAVRGGVGAGRALSSLLVVPPTPSLDFARRMVDTARGGAVVTNPWGPDFDTDMAAPFALDPATDALAEQLMAEPPSVFRGEIPMMVAEFGVDTPDAAFEQLRTEELRYRDVLYTVAARILPPQIQIRIPMLLDAFDALDRRVYGRDVPERETEFPVRDLPDNGRLRPVVRKITVRAPGADPISVRNIANDLTRLLREQTYLAPAG
ncbi:hypothetical protein ASD78_05305 [Lysobacter sp. Root667]|uniref:hypothetical protein n=1 Tax=Lysobacter sp. Root667 TaxID=1736581 RepID=UPI0006F3AB67|nr:hypothetical protein [Lysobacter sp. Root667]KRA77027.1 hypothetical protein ASD78_05305 [Lysobacter sp. Root667]